MTIYLVRRHDGTFMAYGQCWVAAMEDAQVYVKVGPAKSRITRWVRSHANEPYPTLLMQTFTEDDMHVVDMSESTSKAISRIQRRKLEQAKINAAWEIENLTRRHAEIQQRLTALQTTTP